ncbi:MAG: hypothetical protein Q9207_006637 [Kuettlingeria erythrocarpa]
MEASHPRLALILLLICLLSIRPALSLPASPQVPAVELLPQLRDDAAIDRTVGNLLRALAGNPNIRYREAALLSVSFTVDRVEDTHLPTADRTLSSNIGDFRDIECLFRYGGLPPQGAGDILFTVKNQFPLHWDQWSPPQYFPGFTIITPFNWDHVTQRMSIGMADALLKASGQRGRYAGVTLAKPSGFQGPLSWCFHGVKNWRGKQTDFRVDILSRKITRVDRCGLDL